MIVMRMSSDDEVNFIFYIDSDNAEIVKDNNAFGDLILARVNNYPIATTQVNRNGLASSRAENGNFDRILFRCAV